MNKVVEARRGEIFDEAMQARTSLRSSEKSGSRQGERGRA